MYVTHDKDECPVPGSAGCRRDRTSDVRGFFRHGAVLLLMLFAIPVLMTGCQSAPKRIVEFNAFEISNDAANSAVFGHELLAPSGLDRSNAIRLGQLCAAKSADRRGYSHIIFLEEAVVDRETGWEMPRFRVRLQARYVDASADSAMGARDLMSVLTTELGPIDLMALNCG